MAEKKPINKQNLVTLISLAILVGTELTAMTWAAGWALGGIFELPPLFRRVFEVTGFAAGIAGLYYFMRTAVKADPIRG